MLVSLYEHLKRGRHGLERIAFLTFFEQELQRNPFDGFLYPLNGLSIGVLLGSTQQVRFRATLPQNIHIHFFHPKQKTPRRSFIEVVQSLKPTHS